MVAGWQGTGEAAWKVSDPGSLEEMVQFVFAGSGRNHREGGDHRGAVSPGVQRGSSAKPLSPTRTSTKTVLSQAA